MPFSEASKRKMSCMKAPHFDAAMYELWLALKPQVGYAEWLLAKNNPTLGIAKAQELSTWLNWPKEGLNTKGFE